MKKIVSWLLVPALLLAALPALAEPSFYTISDASAEGFGQLLVDLLRACKYPSEEAAQRVAGDVEAIRALNEADYLVAEAVSAAWERWFLDPEPPLLLYGGETEALSSPDIPDSPAHAILVMGFQLENGQMTEELKGRCEAAAAVARALPQAVLVCSGGATGGGNPEGHTEAGLMKAYLAETCGIEASRIYAEEQALSTAENALFIFPILRELGVETATVVTSSYHQPRCQLLFGALSQLYRLEFGSSPEISGNYCFPVKAPFYQDAMEPMYATLQLGALLDLPPEVLARIPEGLKSREEEP